MGRAALLLSAVALAACGGSNTPAAPTPSLAGPRHPFPQHVSYAAGTIRPSRRSQAQQDDDVRSAYEHWKAGFLVSAGSAADGRPLYRVTFGSRDPGRTVSEGQGFGMLIVTMMAGHDPNARTLFDGLWLFSRAHPSRIDGRLMSWEVPEQPPNVDSAFDGDCDIAYALLLADRQWGSGGRVNYRDAASQVLAGILASTIGPASRLPMLGDWVDADGSVYNQYTPRSSDFMTGHFRAFARATGDPAWSQVVASTQSVVSRLQARFSQDTGLLPDFIVPVSRGDHTPRPAPPDFLEGANDGDYYYNACRDPWRLGTDALLSGDPESLTQARKIANWTRLATGGSPSRIRPGYRLDGSPLSSDAYFTTVFVAPIGVAAMTETTQQQWLDDLYEAVHGRFEDYYEDSVTLLCLLVMTGNFWDPSTSD